MKSLLLFASMLSVLAAGGYAQTIPPSSAAGGRFVDLDHVVAVINGDVLLQSDVDEEMHFAVLEPFRRRSGSDTSQDALRRLIDRTLIVQQMKEQRQFNIDISDAEVEKSLQDLRARLPQCAKWSCKTSSGWRSFLEANGLTEAEVKEHWKRRLAILRFIDVRFETGIRIPPESVETYYTKTVAPVFVEHHEAPPPLKDVAARIQQILLEQQVNGMLQDWLKSLHQEGSVRIVDPSYASVEPNSGEEEQER